MRLLKSTSPFALAVASLLLFSSCGGQPGMPGMRLFKADYRIDSNRVLSAAYDESDAVPIKDLWDSLADAPMSMTIGSQPITPDPADPLKAVLSGDIEVSIVHAGDLLSSAKVKQITLKRDSDTSDFWYPDTATLKALADAATY